MEIKSFISDGIIGLKVLGIMTAVLIVLAIELLKDPKAFKEIIGSWKNQ